MKGTCPEKYRDNANTTVNVNQNAAVLGGPNENAITGKSSFTRLPPEKRALLAEIAAEPVDEPDETNVPDQQ